MPPGEANAANTKRMALWEPLPYRTLLSRKTNCFPASNLTREPQPWVSSLCRCLHPFPSPPAQCPVLAVEMRMPLLDSRKGSLREGSTANLEHFHSGCRKGGPEETKCISSHAILAEREESCGPGRVLLYRDETCTQFPPLIEPWQRLWLVIQLSFSY